MLPWLGIAALKCTLGHALVALQEKFYPLTPAQLADGAGITCHLVVSSSHAQRELHATPLWWSAAIVRNRCDISDRSDVQAGGLQRADCRLATRAWSLDVHFDLPQPVLHRLARRRLGSHLRSRRATLTEALEALST